MPNNLVVICFKCGGGKGHPLALCTHCHAKPTSDDDLAISMMLTSEMLQNEKLIAASQLIKSGQPIVLPPNVRKALLAAINAARSRPPTSKKKMSLMWKIRILVIALIFLIAFINSSWARYKWASMEDTIPAYETFLIGHARSQYGDTVRDRLHVLKEDGIWKGALASRNIHKVRAYLGSYPNGKYSAEAIPLRALLADELWPPLATSRSEDVVLRYLRTYPEITIRETVERRLRELYSDITWVQEQGTPSAYKRYLELNPRTKDRAAIEKRIIDIEVADIMSRNPGSLPKSQPTRLDARSTRAKIEIENQTQYELTIRYSGTESKKIVIPQGESTSVEIRTGAYTVTASVPAGNVRDYAGFETLLGGNYDSRFFISTERR